MQEVNSCSLLFHPEEHPEDSDEKKVYKGHLPDLLPPEHFLWQLQGSFPGFDRHLGDIYGLQHLDEKNADDEIWPDDVLIPGDFYTQGVITEPLLALMPKELAPLLPKPGEFWKPGEKITPHRTEAAVTEIPEEEQPQGEDDSGDSDDLTPEEKGLPEDIHAAAADAMSPDDLEAFVSGVQSWIACASWEVYKDVVSYSPEDFSRITGLGFPPEGRLPASLLTPVNVFGFWLSLAGQNFELHSEPCLGCFVFKGRNIADGPTLNVGFVTQNSYYDYAIPLTSHASLYFILKSSTEFLSKEPGNPKPMSEEEVNHTVKDLYCVWARILPVIINTYQAFARQKLLARRRECAGGRLLDGEDVDSPEIHYWRWSELRGVFSQQTFPALLQSGLRREALQNFIEAEEIRPTELAPAVSPSLN